MRDVTIKSALNGYVVRLGCQRIVFTDRTHMLQELDKYLENPCEMEEMYKEKSINSRQLGFVSNFNTDTHTTPEQCYPEPATDSSYED